MPSFPIIDTHLHLWNPKHLRYPWLDEVPLLNRSFLLEDFRMATEAINIEKMVFVQCECEFSQCEVEVDWITKLASIDTRIKGIVAWAPLEKGVLAEEVLQRYAGNKLVKGIRRIIQFEKDPEFCLRKEFIEAVRLLAKYDLSFDICVSHSQLGHVTELIKACPDIQFVLDHFGKPDIKNQQFEPWRSDIETLSHFKNVCCKVSGLVTEADFDSWKESDLLPYINYVLEYFTPDRIIYGGDWPVITQAAMYPQWISTLDNALSKISIQDMYKIYYKNAERFYRLV